MKFITIASTLILASSALAAPFSHIRQARHLRRATNANTNSNANSTATTRKTVPPKYVTLETSSASNSSNVEYSENWAGAVLIGTSFTSVTGTFTVPTPTSEGSGSAWVGIDGDTCDTAILQTGVDWTYSRGSVSYDAWYEWYPDYAYDFSGITISAGDSITVTVTATSSTSGTAVLENTTTGTTVTHTFSNEASLGSLCEYNAEWIVEDFEEDESLVDFADFGTVTFTDCSATDSSGTVGVEDATIIDIEQNNEVLTDCSVSGDSEVICTYVG